MAAVTAVSKLRRMRSSSSSKYSSELNGNRPLLRDDQLRMEELSSVQDSARDNLWADSLPDADGDREGGGGNGLPSSFPNSLNNRSRPGCICLAIIG